MLQDKPSKARLLEAYRHLPAFASYLQTQNMEVAQAVFIASAFSCGFLPISNSHKEIPSCHCFITVSHLRALQRFCCEKLRFHPIGLSVPITQSFCKSSFASPSVEKSWVVIPEKYPKTKRTPMSTSSNLPCTNTTIISPENGAFFPRIWDYQVP